MEYWKNSKYALSAVLMLAAFSLIVFLMSPPLSGMISRTDSGYSTSQASTDTIEIRLTLPDNTNSVYVPGLGPRTVGQLSDATWPSPGHYYISSWLSNSLYGLVHNYQNPVSIGFEKTGDNHTIILTQNVANSRAFIVFTEGDWKKIDNRMGLVESSSFLEKVSPTFGYGLGLLHPLKVVLEYPEFDIEDCLFLHRGVHEVVFLHNRTDNNIKVIHNSR